jgi:transcription-repair coupling factor (superfamily II helicase)
LDIPNVNTLIVNDADNLGLAQLYQLRGRVGRSNRLAYAYFTYRRDKNINPIAEKRLAAIREFTEFGSSFKIAMRDLELRGAGNLLGPEQHGHMLAVGFELYCRLLSEAVNELRGKPKKLEPAPTLELNIDAYINDAYISMPGLKIELYQRLAETTDPAELKEIREEICDRYGEPPLAVQRLLKMTFLKLLAREVKIVTVRHQAGEVVITFSPDHQLAGEKLLWLAQGFPGRLSFSTVGGLTMRVKVTGLKQETVLALLEEIFTKLKQAAQVEMQGLKRTENTVYRTQYHT